MELEFDSPAARGLRRYVGLVAQACELGMDCSFIELERPVRDNSADRWDLASVHEFDGTYGDYLLNKVSKVFPQLRRNVL